MDMDVVGNKERLLKGILDGETTTDIEPVGNKERLLYGILKGETESNIEPASRVERLLKAILENGGGGGGTGVVTKAIAGTIANPFSVEEANEIWNAIHGGTGDAHLTITLPSFGSVTARFGAEPYEEGVNALLASITAPVGNRVAALCLMYLVTADTIFLAQKLTYAITPSSEPSVMDESALISNNLSTITTLTKYNTELVLDSLDATYNGTFKAPDGVAYDPVTVNVSPNVGSKSITANGNYSSSSDNLDGYSSVSVNVAAVSKLPQVVDKTVTEIAAADLAGATALGNSAFYGCTRLTSITIPSSVTSIGEYAFNNCTRLTSITIPSSVTSIGEYAFNNCTSLASIPIPSGVTSIGDAAFKSCSSLTSITIPSNVTSIGGNTFYGCTRLTSITIPSSVTSIGRSAFSGCTSLASVICEATTPPTLANANAFSGTHADLVIYVPAASVSAYQSATNWSTYASKIQAIPNP